MLYVNCICTVNILVKEELMNQQLFNGSCVRKDYMCSRYDILILVRLLCETLCVLREYKRKLIYAPECWYALVRWAKAEIPSNVLLTAKMIFIILNFYLYIPRNNVTNVCNNVNMRRNSIKKVNVKNRNLIACILYLSMKKEAVTG